VGSVRDDEGRSPGEKPGPVAPDARRVYIHEKDVERVEIQLREAPAFDFFKYEVLEDDDASEE
jgi:hypothetical protein